MNKQILRLTKSANIFALTLFSVAIPSGFAQPTQPLVAIHHAFMSLERLLG